MVDWVEPRPEGIFVAPAELWIDPSRAMPRAAVTHGHADHARGGHGRVLATTATLDIMALRYGPSVGIPMEYGQTITDHGVDITFHPAGHILGSAQIALRYRGETVVITGDYKRSPDPTCAAFIPVACDVLITEATFALPVFTHPPIGGEIARLLAARERHPDRAIIVGAYALGKAQRVIAELRAAGYHAPIYLHGAMLALCALYERHGVALGDLRPATGEGAGSLAGQIIIAPPSALHDRWTRRFADPLLAMASGWMRLRQRARQKNIDLPLIISDHADWPELTTTIAELRPAQTWITHGRSDALTRWCALHQLSARALELAGREDDDADAGVDADALGAAP